MVLDLFSKLPIPDIVVPFIKLNYIRDRLQIIV